MLKIFGAKKPKYEYVYLDEGGWIEFGNGEFLVLESIGPTLCKFRLEKREES